MKPRLLSTARLSFPLATAIAALLVVPSASAASLTWDSGNTSNGSTIDAGDGAWDLSATHWNNGSGNVAWTQAATNDATNAAIFAGADGTLLDPHVVTIGATSMATESITFNSSHYQITGGTLALIVTPASPGPAANGSITVAADKTATINSLIAYNNNTAAAITVNSGGILNLGGGANNSQYNFSGGGTVNMTAGAYAANVGSIAVSAFNQTGGTFTITPGNGTSYNISSNAQNVIYTLSAGTLSVNGNSTTASVNNAHLGIGSGTTTAFTSTLKVDGGTMNVGTTASRSGEIQIGRTAVSNGTLNVTGGTVTIGTGSSANQIYLFKSGATTGYAATMTQSGGTVTTNGIQFGGTTGTYSSTATATLTLSGGSLYVGAAGITKGSAAGSLAPNIQLQGGTLGASQNWSSALDMKLGTTDGGPSIRAQDSGSNARDITLSGVLSNDGAVNGTLTKTGTGILILSGTNTYTGATTVSTGTLQLGNGSTTGALTGTASITNNATLAVNRSDGFTQATDLNGKIISGSGSFTQAGSGTTTLSLANTYTGATTISAGKILMTNASALQYSAYNTTGSTGAIGLDVTSGLSSGTLTLGGLTGGVNVATAITGYTSVTNLTLNPQVGSNPSYSGVIANGAAGMTLTKTGAGAQILTASNTYTGDTTISSGTLRLSGSGRLGSGNYAGAMSIALGATFETANGGTQTLSGPITGGGTLTNSGGGGLILSNAGNSFGALSISNVNSRVFINHATALPAAATVNIASGALVFAAPASRGNAITVASGGTLTARAATILSNVTLPGSGNVIFNNDDANTQLLTVSNDQTLTGDLTVQIGGNRMIAATTALGAVTLSGKLSGVGGLVVASSGNFANNPTLFGTGVLTLSGANDYTGATTVTTGTLVVDGSTAAGSAVSVGSGGTLGGTGTIGGTLALTGVLAPGDAGVVDVETLNAGTTTWNGGSIWNFDLSSSNNTSDRLAITGDLVKGTGTLGTDYVFNFMGSQPVWSTTYTLATFDAFTGFDDGLNFTATNLGAGSYSTSFFTLNAGSLTFTAVPEPTSALAGLLIGAGLLRRRRRNVGC